MGSLGVRGPLKRICQGLHPRHPVIGRAWPDGSGKRRSVRLLQCPDTLAVPALRFRRGSSPVKRGRVEFTAARRVPLHASVQRQHSPPPSPGLDGVARRPRFLLRRRCCVGADHSGFSMVVFRFFRFPQVFLGFRGCFICKGDTENPMGNQINCERGQQTKRINNLLPRALRRDK